MTSKTVVLILALIFSFHDSLTGQTSFRLAGQPGVATRMGFGARGIGMGNAMSALNTGGTPGYYNPALAPFQETPSGDAAAGFLPLDRFLNTLNYSQKLPPTAGISLGIINTGVGDLEGRNRDGVVTEMYSTSENVFLLSFGTKVDDNTALGISTKIFYYSLFEGVSSTTVGFDIGFLTSLTEDLTLGVVIQDINSKYKWDTSSLYGQQGNTTIEKFPLRRKIGLAYASRPFAAIATGEFEWIGSVLLARFGLEKELSEGIAVRGGVDQISFNGEIDAKPSLGFSLQTPIALWNPSVHYAYVFEPYSPGGIHILSIKLSFE